LLRRIHRQDADRRAPDRGQSDGNDAIVSQVFLPPVAARMEESHDLIRHRINSGQVRPFVEVAMMTRKREVRRIVGATVLPGDNVFDVKRHEREVRLSEPAILAALSCSLADELANRGVRHAEGLLARKTRALRCKIPMTWIACT
jgi:hypothetical protein